MTMPSQIKTILQNGQLDHDDVLALRRLVYGDDGVISAQEADWLFQLDEHCTSNDDSWAVFFCEAMADFMVHQMQPSGYVSEENASWLVSRISQDDRVKTATELELLIRILEAARSVPEQLEIFALRQVHHGVLHGNGATRQGNLLQPGSIGEVEVNLLRRILYAAAGSGSIAISQAEAEVLFDISDATAGAQNHPSWADLFIKAIANYLMALSGYSPPSRDKALKRDDWFENNAFDLGRFYGEGDFGGFFASSLRAVLGQYSRSDLSAAHRREMQKSAEIETNERVSEQEARWLAGRIERDGQLHSTEKELLKFLHAESPEIHPALRHLLEKVA